jgi:hypothetical protein
MSQNLVSNHMDAGQWSGVDEALDLLEQRLAPIVIALDAGKRRRLVRMGDGSEPFCRKTYIAGRDNRHALPATLDVEEMGRDLESHDEINKRLTRLTRLMEKVRDTEAAVGSDVMTAALATYHFLQAAGGEGLDEVNRELAKRFEGQGKRPEPATA